MNGRRINGNNGFIQQDVRRLLRLAVLTITSLFAFGIPAHAGQYEITKGKGVEVCEAYKKNLNLLSSNESPPVCAVKIDPKFSDIKIPKWREWSSAEIWQRRHLVREIEKRIASMGGNLDKDLTDAGFYSRLKANLDSGQYKLSLSEATFMWRDGRQATYIKHETSCDEVVDYNEPMGRIFFVLNKNGDHIVAVETLATDSQTPFRRPDIVLYKAEPFLQYWTFGELEVSGITTAVHCKIRYVKPSR